MSKLKEKPGEIRKLFSVMGHKRGGRATALIIADSEADAEYFALNELDFITVSQTILTSEFVHIGPAGVIE
jgi:hypothetical protein